MIAMIEQAGIYAAIVAAAVEAIRSKFPVIDGWVVIALAAALSVAVCWLAGYNGTDFIAIDVFRMAILTCVVAVGGNAWIAKIAGKINGGA
jgi:hypothetical protein